MAGSRAVLRYGAALGLALAVIWAGTWGLLRNERERADAQAQAQAARELELIGPKLEAALREGKPRLAADILQRWSAAHPGEFHLRLIDGQGFEVARTAGSPGGAGPPPRRLALSNAGESRAAVELTRNANTAVPGFRRWQATLIGAALGLSLLALALGGVLIRRRQEAHLLREYANRLQQADTALKEAARDNEGVRTCLRGALDAMPFLLVGVDPEGRVIEWNTGAENVTGISRQCAQGQPFEDLLPLLAGHAGKVREAVRCGTRTTLPRLSTVSAGAVLYLDAEVIPLPGASGPAALLRLADASEREHFSRMMIADGKSTIVGGLVAGVARAVNSPLSGILQNAQNIERRLSPQLQVNQRTARAVGLDLERLAEYMTRRDIPGHLERLRESARRAAGIVADMLAFGGGGGDRAEKVSAADLMESAMRLIAEDADAATRDQFQRLEIVREYAGELPLLHCRRADMQLVLHHLLRNAVQALHGSAEPRRIRLRIRRDGSYMVFEVEDNGAGMDEAVRKRLFDPFFSTRPPSVGTGLGLKVVRYIVVDRHDGALDVSSQPGRGSCFSVRLPLRTDAKARAEGDPAVVAGEQPRRDHE